MIPFFLASSNDIFSYIFFSWRRSSKLLSCEVDKNIFLISSSPIPRSYNPISVPNRALVNFIVGINNIFGKPLYICGCDMEGVYVISFTIVPSIVEALNVIFNILLLIL